MAYLALAITLTAFATLYAVFAAVARAERRHWQAIADAAAGATSDHDDAADLPALVEVG